MHKENKNLMKKEHPKEQRTRPKRDVVADRARFIEERMDDIMGKWKGERK